MFTAEASCDSFISSNSTGLRDNEVKEDPGNSHLPSLVDDTILREDPDFSHLDKECALIEFKCQVCSKILRDGHTLKCHIKTVHGEKKLACEKCDKKFAHRGALNAHAKTHSNAAYTCSICNQSIKDQSYYRKHVRSHSNPRPHCCPICGKSYIQKSHLTVHMSIHSEKKPYKCIICSKSFRLAKAFKEHQNMHKNKRNLKCPHCPYSSCFQKNLQSHIRNHAKHKEEAAKKLEGKTETKQDEPKTRELMISTEDSLRDVESPVYLLVNLEPEDIECLNPLDMAQELCITTQPDKYGDDYRPLDLSTVATPLRSGHEDLSLKVYAEESLFCPDVHPTRDVNDTGFAGNDEEATAFQNLELNTNRSMDYSTSRSETDPPNDITDQYLSFQNENNNRRRSVFLAEQLEYEHQGEMRIVDPAEVTG